MKFSNVLLSLLLLTNLNTKSQPCHLNCFGSWYRTSSVAYKVVAWTFLGLEQQRTAWSEEEKILNSVSHWCCSVFRYKEYTCSFHMVCSTYVSDLLSNYLIVLQIYKCVAYQREAGLKNTWINGKVHTYHTTPIRIKQKHLPKMQNVLISCGAETGRKAHNKRQTNSLKTGQRQAQEKT